MTSVLIIDNYDSFTYNLVHLLKDCGYQDLLVRRNDCFELTEVKDFDKVLLSPGPGIPQEAGLMPELVTEYASSKSILGVPNWNKRDSIVLMDVLNSPTYLQSTL